jgi:hypothetical protein
VWHARKRELGSDARRLSDDGAWLIEKEKPGSVNDFNFLLPDHPSGDMTDDTLMFYGTNESNI